MLENWLRLHQLRRVHSIQNKRTYDICALTMSAIRGSSGFGCASNICREVSKPLSVITGRHVPFGGRRSKSRHIRPATSTFGWYTGVTKRT
jgi:hypothetical protein